MNKEKQIVVPELRFKDFQNDKEWKSPSIQSLIDNEIIISHLDGNHGALYPKSEEFSEKGVPYVTANDFVNGYVDFSNSKRLPLERAKKFKKGVSINGDILFAHNATVGPVAKLKTDLDFVILSTTATYFRCDNIELINDFLKHSLSSSYFVEQYSRVMSQSTRNQVPITTQRKFFLFLPNSKEQSKIANCLSSLDVLITAETEKLENLKDHKKGLLQQLFPANGETKPQFRFPEFEGDGDWIKKTLGGVSKITTGNSNREDSTEEAGKYTFFDRSQDIRTSNRFLFDGEAIIVAGEGQEFKPKYFIGKFDLHQRAYAILDFDDKTIGKFLYYSIYKNRSYFLRYAVGSTVKSLRLPIFQNMPTLIPSNPKEHQTIANCLSSADDLIEAQKTKIKSLKEHKKGLMQQLFPNTTNQ
jgi:type I restriction enzyme S subunit